jgi:small subunit ribosomal protein S17
MDGKLKKKTGIVTSNKMNKTVIVTEYMKIKHPIYGKPISKRKKYFVHDEKNICKEGDVVQIIEIRPYSKHKRWNLLNIIKSIK